MRFIKSARFSTVGVFFAGIIAVIQGCSLEKEGALFAVLLLILQFCSAPVEETTTGGGAAAPTKIIMFSAGLQPNGDFDPNDDGKVREAVDALCATAAATASITLPNIHAFISINVNDQIGPPAPTSTTGMDTNFGVPTNVPITGPSGDIAIHKIADDWADLLDGTLDQTLNKARVLGRTGIWWSGASANGRVHGKTCMGWTNQTRSVEGLVGDSQHKNSSWTGIFVGDCDRSTRQLLCIAY